MKKIYILLCALAALAAASCTEKEEFVPTGELVTREFSTLLTKTTLANAEGVVHWEDGDAINILYGSTGNQQFKIQSHDEASAVFSGKVDSGASEFYAVYPYNGENSLAGSTLTATVPASQTLRVGSFQSGAAVAVAYTTGNTLAFHQATAILGITLADYMTNVESIEFSGNNNEFVAGEVSIAMNTSTGAINSVTPPVTGSKEVTLEGGSFSAGGTYYLSFIPQNFTKGVKVIVTFDDGKTAIATSDDPLTTTARTIYPIANFKKVTLPVATFAEKNSFNYDNGTPQTLATLTCYNVASISDITAPDGWNIAWDSVNEQFKVTPPTQDQIKATPQIVDPEGVFEVTLRSAAGHTRQVEIPVRLYGINSLDDLLAFRDKHGATGTLDASKIAALPTTCADYLVGGSLMLNADITLARSTMYSAIPAYFIHHLYVPLNGNNRTITADYKSSLAVCALFQFLHENVSNLNIAGTFDSEYTSGVAQFASLAIQAAKDGIVIENVNSTAELKYNSGSGGIIGGIIARVVRNCKATIQNCTFSGTIDVYNGVSQMGGIIALGTDDTTINEGDRTDIDNCVFSGNINYYSTTHSNSRIGGIMGSNERYGQITNCTSSGDININLYGSTMVSSNARGVGGILGRCNASNASYTMETTVEDCVFSGTITVTNGPSENSSNYNKIIGTDLRPAKKSGNDESLGTINLNGAEAGALSFDDASTVSFAYGETKEFDITASGSVSGVNVASLPAGWTVDCSSWGTGKVSVTAPAQDDIVDNSATGIGSIVLNATLSDASVVAADNLKNIRLYGINNNDEWTAFKTLYGSSNSSYAAGTSYSTRLTSCAEYMVNSEITLNSNITVAGTNNAIHHLEHGLNGNGKTLTINVSGSAWPLGMCQYLYGTTAFTIHDVTLDGTLNWTKDVNGDGGTGIPNLGSMKCCFVGAIAAWNAASDVTIENVINKITITWASANQTTSEGIAKYKFIGGFFGGSSAKTLRFNNCNMKGSISQNCRSFAIGGYVGWNNSTNKIYFDNCTFSGNLACHATDTQTAVQSTNYGMFGGFVGTSDGSADGLLDFTACTSSGTITIDAGARFVGGFVGKASTPCYFRDDASANHCTFSGTIDFTEREAYHSSRDIIGGFVAYHTANILQLTNCVPSDKGKIKLTALEGAEGMDKIDDRVSGVIGLDSSSANTTITDSDSSVVIDKHYYVAD